MQVKMCVKAWLISSANNTIVSDQSCLQIYTVDVSQNGHGCTRTSRHFLSLEDRQVVLHRLQVGGLQITLPLQAVDRVVYRVIDRVAGRIVLAVPTLRGGASHVFWAPMSGLKLPATAVFAKMSWMTRSKPTPARTNRWHEP